MEYRTAFNYEEMAENAGRERDAIKALLEKRKKNPPERADQEIIWRRENGILYTMYLEQRYNAQMLARRAAQRKEREVAACGR